VGTLFSPSPRRPCSTAAAHGALAGIDPGRSKLEGSWSAANPDRQRIGVALTSPGGPPKGSLCITWLQSALLGAILPGKWAPGSRAWPGALAAPRSGCC